MPVAFKEPQIHLPTQARVATGGQVTQGQCCCSSKLSVPVTPLVCFNLKRQHDVPVTRYNT